MHIETAPAKINLSLDVLGKRPDNYHEVSMVMTTIDLNDYLTFEKRRDKRIALTSDSSFIPLGRKNLVFQAAELMQKKYKTNGVSIHIEKNIPIAAGLAGGSSDAAATLRGMNELYNLGVDTETLMEYGATFGSDIPFCVLGGTALATGRGEKIEMLPSPPHGWVILAKPSISVSTPRIYGAIRDRKFTPGTEAMRTAILNNDYDSMVSALKNDLQSVTRQKYKEVDYLIETFKKFGAEGVLMSGSGPTVFAVFKKERQAAKLYNALKGFCNEVYKVRLLG